MQKLAAVLFIVGAIVAIFGESRPVISSVFGAFEDPQLQVEAIQNDLNGWRTANLLMGAGSLIAAVGMLPFARQAHSLSEKNNVRLASNLGVAIAIVGALCWAIVLYNRIANPPQKVVANMDFPSWAGLGYFLLTAVTFVLAGLVLIKTGYSKWFAWPMLVLALLVLVVTLVLGGFIPAVYSFEFLILGIPLLLMRSPKPMPRTA